MKSEKIKTTIIRFISGLPLGIGGIILYSYFTTSEYIRTTNALVLGIVVFAIGIGIVLFVIFYRFDA